jgi:dienelactone hydrolase
MRNGAARLLSGKCAALAALCSCMPPATGCLRSAAFTTFPLASASDRQQLCSIKSADGSPFETLLYRPSAAPAASAPRGAVLVLTDVYGVHDAKNQEWIAAYSEAAGLPVVAPDLFRGVPWSEARFGGDTKSQAYEKWRSEHYLPERVISDIACASLFAREAAGQESQEPVPLAAIGFCFGGGRLLEAIAHADLGGAISSAVAFYPTRLQDTASARSKLSGTPVLIIQVSRLF